MVRKKVLKFVQEKKSSLSILKRIKVTEILPNELVGGTTRPMLVLGEDGRLYVLKLFSKTDASQRPYTVAEIFAHLVAKELNLNTPEAVVMDIPEQLLNLYEKRDPALYAKLKMKDLSKPSFASLYFKDLPSYSPSINDNSLDIYEFESIYAFDMLILNGDRRSIKPNILRGSHYLLIDHEKAFEGINYVFPEDAETLAFPPFHKNHLFYDLLKLKNKKNPSLITFETFQFDLRSVSEKRLTEGIQFCASIGYEHEACYAWLRYILGMKKKSSNFVALLKDSISQ